MFDQDDLGLLLLNRNEWHVKGYKIIKTMEHQYLPADWMYLFSMQKTIAGNTMADGEIA